MAKKIIIRNKPNADDLGIYTFTNENTSNDYLDSNSVAVYYDKFTKQDLFTTSIGDEINEKICDSKIQNKFDSSTNDLKFTGESFFKINFMEILNRGVNSKINDVYYRIYVFTKQFFNPYNEQGNLKNYNQMLSTTDGFRKYKTGTTEQPALFFAQNGPNYGEGGSAGTGLFEDISIIENFDVLNSVIGANITDDDSDGFVSTENVATSPEFHPNKYSPFDPNLSMLKIYTGQDTTLSGPLVDLDEMTTIFQEDGTNNPIYIAIHMDGDQDTTFDRSRNETISIWSINPDELFVTDSEGNVTSGKVTTLEWDNHDIEIFSTNQERTAAFTGRRLSVTINTQGGVDENSVNYNPPNEYVHINSLVEPPIGDYNENTIDDLILEMTPRKQMMSTTTMQENQLWPTGLSGTYYLKNWSKFSDYIPVPYFELNSTIPIEDNDFQIYYEDTQSKTLFSAPNTVNLSLDIALHPEPFKFNDDYHSSHPYYEHGFFTLFFEEDNTSTNYEDYAAGIFNNAKLYSKIKLHQGKYSIIKIPAQYGEVTRVAELIETPDDYFTNQIPPDASYIFFVVDWNDVNDKYKTIDDVLNDWPRTQSQLLQKREKNTYYPQYIDSGYTGGLNNTLTHSYRTSGIKRVKMIVFSHNSIKSNNGIYENSIEPLRWKLVTSKIFLDIPINEFPDFSEVGGSDYTTIPWPYTTAVIGGISQDSKYFKSINDILGGGKIGDLDIIDETFLVSAKFNDELGQNIEKLDLEQVRYFNTGSYDMNKLLNIPTETSEFGDEYYPNPYNEESLAFGLYWNGERIDKTFSKESSVGQIFIGDNSDIDLKENCKLELNTGNLDDKSINDSSGNVNKGLLIGDYKIKKTQKNQPMRRDSYIKTAKKSKNNGAI